MKINCWECGACCKKIGDTATNARHYKDIGVTNPIILELADFPFNFDSTGKCENLDINNKCVIYDRRPDICNVTITYKKYYQAITEEDFVVKMEEACKKLEESLK